MKRNSEKQFTYGELSYIRYMMQACLRTFKSEFYEGDQLINQRERTKHIIKRIDELLYDIDKKLEEKV